MIEYSWPVVLAASLVFEGASLPPGLDAESARLLEAYVEKLTLERGDDEGRQLRLERIDSPWLPTLWRTSGWARGGHVQLLPRYWVVRNGQPWGVRAVSRSLADDQSRITAILACPMDVERMFSRSFLDPSAMPADPFSGCLSLTNEWAGSLGSKRSPDRWIAAGLVAVAIATDASTVAQLQKASRPPSTGTYWFGNKRPTLIPMWGPVPDSTGFGILNGLSPGRPIELPPGGGLGQAPPPQPNLDHLSRALRFSVETSDEGGGTQVWNVVLADSSGWWLDLEGPIGAVRVERE